MTTNIKKTNQKKFHFIYKTICNINNTFYYGIHSTDNLNDGYLGSGKIIKRSIKKYGPENFTREILKFLLNREELLKKEREIITEEIINDPLCLNLALGGGACGNTAHTSEIRLSRIEGCKRFWNSPKGQISKVEMIKKLKEQRSKPKYRLAASEKQRNYRQNQSLEEKQEYSKLMKNIWCKGTEINSRQKEISKRSWENETHRENRVNGLKASWDSKERKEKQSINVKKMWQDPTYREKFKLARVGLKYKKKVK